MRLRKVLSTLGASLALLFSAARADATTCPNATAIASLPVFNQAVVCGAGNDITSSNVTMSCGSTNYYGGNEALYTFTPTNSGAVEISYNGSPSTTYVGIFVFDGCPTTTGTSCVGNITSSALTKTVTVTVTAGTTYYLMFDTWPSPQSPCPGTFSIATCAAPTAPSVSGITTTDATLAWTGTANDYEVEYGTSATLGSGVNTRSGAVSNPYTANGLNPSTGYYWWVRAICGPGDTSAWTTMNSFTTNCLTVPAPYAEGFNSGMLPPCWTNSNSINSTTDANLFWKFNNSNGQPDYGPATNGRPGGTYAWVDASSPQTAVVTLTSPVLDLSGLAVPYIQFDWFKYNTDPAGGPNNNLMVEGYDGTAWVQLFNDTSNMNAWRTERITLPASFAGVTDAQFRFSVDKTLSNNYYDEVLVDSFLVDNAPTCLPPSGASVSAVSSSGATLNWTASASAPNGGYEYEVRSSGMAGSGSTGLGDAGITAGGATTVNATGLNPATAYTAYIRSVCGPGDSSAWVAAGSFMTACVPITMLPWSDGIESVTTTGPTNFPSCWQKVNVNGTWRSSDAAFTSYNDPRNGSRYLTVQWSANNDVIMTPGFQLTAGTSYDFTFYWSGDGYSGWDGIVGVNGTQDFVGATILGSPFVTQSTTTTANTYIQETRTFVPTTSGVYYFGIQVNGNGNPWYLGFDDFSLGVTPTCVMPTGVAASAVTSNSATLNWTASASAPAGGYEYEVRSSGMAGSGATGLADFGTTAAGSTSANATGLAPATAYTAYIRSICGPGDTSAWAMSSTFTTSCAPYTVPFTEEFTVSPLCWTTARGAISAPNTTFTTAAPQWYLNDYLNNPALGQAVNINLYSNTKRDWLISPSIDLGATPGNYTLGFKFGVTDYGDTTTALSLGSDDSVAVVLSTDNGVTWSSTNILRTWTVADGPIPGQIVTIPLTNVSGMIKFAFYATEGVINDPEDNDIFVDSVTVISASPVVCMAPTGVTASSITTNSAVISWTAPTPAPASGYQYVVRSGSIVASGSTAAGTTTATVTGLAASSTDTVYVRSICAAGDTSAWSTGVAFTTSAPCTAPIVNLGNDTTICAGNVLNLNAGNAGSTYLWSTGATIQSIDVITSGTYSVAVTNAAGCVGRDTINVTVNPLPVVNLGNDTAICAGSSLTLNAGNAATPNATYVWSTGAVTQTISVSNTGFYSVVANNGGCVAVDTIHVTVNPLPVAGTITTTGAAPTFTFSASGTSNATSQSWNFGDGMTSTTANPTHTYTVNGTYTVTYKVANACGMDSTTTTVVVGSPCTVPVVALGNDTTICAGSSLTLNAGNAGASYMWSNNATTQSITVTPSGSQSYYVAVTAGGCTGFDTINVTVGPLPVVNLGNDTTICSGGIVTLNAGNAGASYLWSNGGTSQTISVTASGAYNVRVTNTNGCIGRDTINVTVNPLPVVALGNDTTICSGSSVTLNAGNAGSTYLWSNGATTQTTSVSAAGNYSVAVTNANGCIGRDTVMVMVSPVPVVNLGNDTTICSGNSVTLNAGNAGSTYLWSNGASTQTAVVSAAGSYSVVVTNAGGCIGRDTINVTVAPTPVVNLGNDTTICVSASLTLNAGNAGASYVWSTGATTQTITVNATGTYSVAVTGAGGCIARDTIMVSTNPAPLVALGNDTAICAGGSITLNAGNAGAAYNWSTGASTQTISVGNAGSYSVAVTDANGCTGRDTINVMVTPLPVAGTITTTGQSPTFTFSVSGAANATVSGWRFGDGAVSTSQNPTHTYTANGTYTVTYYVANACGADSITTTVDVTNIGVTTVSLDGKINLFPNPANDYVVIQNTAAQAMKAIRILDIAGATVSDIKVVNGAEQRLDISHLAAGSYLVRIELEDGAIAVRRLQVKH